MYKIFVLYLLLLAFEILREAQTTKGPLCVCVCVYSVMSIAASWTVAHQAPLSVGFPRQEYWSGLPFPPPGKGPIVVEKQDLVIKNNTWDLDNRFSY